MKTPDYQPRYYRDWSKDRDLVSFNVVVKETDLYIRARRQLKDKAFEIVQRQRSLLENYIARHPGFIAALEPFPVGEDAPAIARAMAEACREGKCWPHGRGSRRFRRICRTGFTQIFYRGHCRKWRRYFFKDQ